MRTSTHKLTATAAGILLAASLLPAAALTALSQPEPALAVTAPTLSLTRANTGKVTIKKGTTYKIGAKATSGSSLTYSSSKKSVATVSSKGTITAKGYGSATITVKAKKSGKVTTKKVALTVTSSGKYKPVSKVYAQLDDATLTVGGSTKASATFSPTSPSNRNVTFKSSNTDVATVSSYGTVKAKKAGTAYITLTSCYSSTKYAKVKLTVKAKPAPQPQPVVPTEVPVRSCMNDYSWGELKAIANEISQADTGKLAMYTAQWYNLISSTGKLTGDECKTVTMTCRNSSGATFTAKVRIQLLGIYHDTMTGTNGKKAGLTFGFKDIVDYQPANPEGTNSGGFAASKTSAWLEDTSSDGFFNRLPQDLRTHIVAVDKICNITGAFDYNDSPVKHFANRSFRVWLPSVVEVRGTMGSTFAYRNHYNSEGDQYKLYRDNAVPYNTLASSDVIPFIAKSAPGHTSPEHWWTRSCSPNHDYVFDQIRFDRGDWGFWPADSQDYTGIAPCFCF
ncbi:MAG: Ig-like domain-containing protein [Coriobacteriia bacterium]|nr:Ig-like domain-containing protein [Coriobacteriia bacterium]